MDSQTAAEQTTEQIVKADLQALIARIKPQIFTKEAAPMATDEETLGIAIAKYFDWSGTPIVKTFYEALEDANYADFSAEVLRLAERDGFIPTGEAEE